MRKTFNFLDAQTGLDKIMADLERQHPDRSHAWIRKQAQVVLAERQRRAVRQRTIDFAIPRRGAQ